MTEKEVSSTGQSAHDTPRRVLPAVTLLSLVGIVSVVGFRMSDDTPTQPENTQVAASADPGNEIDSGVPTEADSTGPAAGTDTEPELSPEDAERVRLLLGVWEQERFGRRLMTVNADGTATMVIRPAGLLASTFGFDEQIDLEMYWKVKDGHIDYGVSGGSPPDQVKAASAMWGDHWVEKIETLTDEELILLDQSTSAPSKWQRVPALEQPGDTDAAPDESPGTTVESVE